METHVRVCDQCLHPKRGSDTVRRSRCDSIAETRRCASSTVGHPAGETMVVQVARRAPAGVENAIAWSDAHEHHRAAHAAHCRRVIGEERFCACGARDIEKMMRNSRTARMQMHDIG